MGGAHWWVGPTHRRRRRGFEEGVRWAAGTRASSGPWRGGGGEERTGGWARLWGGLFPFLSYFFISSSFYFEFSSSFSIQNQHAL
jgi:hypothetical protein